MITMNVHMVDSVTAKAKTYESSPDCHGFTSLAIKFGSDRNPCEVTVYGLPAAHAHRLAAVINESAARIEDQINADMMECV